MAAGGFSASSLIFQNKKPPKIVGRYLLGDLLGEGAQGKVRGPARLRPAPPCRTHPPLRYAPNQPRQVKEAVDSESLRRVAIKIVNLRQLRKGVRNAEEMLKHELTIHRRLKHANVVELIEEFRVSEKEKLYIVLELVHGASLQDLANSMPDNVLPEALSTRFMRQLFHGLAYCHSKGVVHRDIKPSNLMVSSDGVLKIADFGVSEEIDKYQQADTCSKSRGSPAFQPPEVASGGVQFSGFKVDVWAAGISLFLLATGRVPFEGTSLINLFENIADGSFEIPQRIAADAPLVELIRGLLTVEQQQRYSVSDALKHRWLRDDVDDSSDSWHDAERRMVLGLREQTFSSSVLGHLRRTYGDAFGEAARAPDAAAAAAQQRPTATTATAALAMPPIQQQHFGFGGGGSSPQHQQHQQHRQQQQQMTHTVVAQPLVSSRCYSDPGGASTTAGAASCPGLTDLFTAPPPVGRASSVPLSPHSESTQRLPAASAGQDRDEKDCTLS